MSYREIIVNDTTYRYTIGRTHVKFHGGPAVPYVNTETEIAVMGSDYVDLDINVRVTPKHIRAYILAHMAS